MAEQNSQQQNEQPRTNKWGQRLWNYIVTGIRKTPIAGWVKRLTHEEIPYGRYTGQELLNMQSVLRLKEKNLLNIFRNRVDRVSAIEAEWDEFDKLPKGEGHEAEGGFRYQVETLYQKSMIYLNPSTSEFEYRCYQNGSKELGNIPEDVINLNSLGKEYEFPLPPKVKIRYPISMMKKDWIVEISPFGYQKTPEYISKYSKIVEEMCKDAIAKHSQEGKDEAEIRKYTEIVERNYKTIIADTIKKIASDFEYKHYGFVKTAQEVAIHIEGIYTETAQKLLMKPITKKDFVYFNTYKIIQPIVYGTGKNNAKRVEMLVSKEELENNPEKFEMYTRQGVKLVPWEVKPGEIGPGLDQFGYPLEVDDDNIIMLDKGNGAEGSKRQVPNPEHFVKMVDALEFINYVNNYFDTVRDDLRDGRYHPKSLTINEYLHENNPSLWGLWKSKEETGINETDIKEQSVVNIKLNPDDREVPITVRSSDKNPCFDLKLLEDVDVSSVPSWRHAGRKYYYMPPDGVVQEDMPDRHISSRGVSMYIIEKITREIEKFDAETVAVLNEIAKDNKGFDYGTIAWEDWGSDRTKKPYSWPESITKVNFVPTPKRTPESYKGYYESQKPK